MLYLKDQLSLIVNLLGEDAHIRSWLIVFALLGANYSTECLLEKILWLQPPSKGIIIRSE